MKLKTLGAAPRICSPTPLVPLLIYVRW